MNSQRNEEPFPNYVLIIMGIICLIIGIQMVYQNTLVTIANKSYSGGLAFLLVGLIITMVALASLVIRKGARNTLILVFLGFGLLLVILVFLGFGLLLGYAYWSVSRTFTIPETIKYEVFKDLLAIILSIATIFIAVVGYGVYRILEKNIEDLAKKLMDQTYLRALATTIMRLGYTFWESYEADRRRNINLKHAIELTNHANEHVVNLDETKKENQRLICKVRNNLAYYLAELCRLGIGTDVDRNLALDHAEYVFGKKEIFAGEELEQIIHTYNYVRQQCTGQPNAPKKRG